MNALVGHGTWWERERAEGRLESPARSLLGVLASVGLGCLVLAVMGPGGPKYVDTFGHREISVCQRMEMVNW